MTTELKKYTIDAAGKSLGRVASQAAKYLIGKESTDYARNVVANVKVEIVNAAKVKLSDKKLRDTTHTRYSGYPGGITTLSSAQVVAQKGYKELMRKAVDGMLPKNKLRDVRIKNLIISE